MTLHLLADLLGLNQVFERVRRGLEGVVKPAREGRRRRFFENAPLIPIEH